MLMAPEQRKTYLFLFLSIAVIGLVLDIGTKYWVFASLYPDETFPHGKSFPLIPGAFSLTAQFTPKVDTTTGFLGYLRTISGDRIPHVNHGALFGFGQTQGDRANLAFLLVILLAAIAIGYWVIKTAAKEDFFLCLSLGLILAGTLGNFYDRLVFGGVRDFLLWYKWIDWPVFNIADCCLVCGASLLLIQALFFPHEVPEKKNDSGQVAKQEVLETH